MLIYEEILDKNTNLINNTEYLTPPGYSLIETPSSINSNQPKIIRLMQNTTDNYVTPANPKIPRQQRSRTITLSSVDVQSKSENQRKLKLNNVSVKYTPNTGEAISVISENVAKVIGAEVNPYDRTKN